MPKSGDVDAAVGLLQYWRNELQPLSSRAQDEGYLIFVQDAIAEFELLILENTVKHPLFTLSAAYMLSFLYFTEAVLAGVSLRIN